MEPVPKTNAELLLRMQVFEQECVQRCAALDGKVSLFMLDNGIPIPVIPPKRKLDDSKDQLQNKIVLTENRAIENHLSGVQQQIANNFKNFLMFHYKTWLENPQNFHVFSCDSVADKESVRQIKRMSDLSQNQKNYFSTMLDSISEFAYIAFGFKVANAYPLPASKFSALFSPYTADMPIVGYCKAFRLHNDSYHEDPLLTGMVCQAFYSLNVILLDEYFNVAEPEAFFALSFQVGKATLKIQNLNWYTFELVVSSCANKGEGYPRFFYRKTPKNAHVLLEPAVITDVTGKTRTFLPLKDNIWHFLGYAAEKGNVYALKSAEELKSFLIPALIESFFKYNEEWQGKKVGDLNTILKRLMARTNIAHPDLCRNIDYIHQLFIKRFSVRKKPPKFLDLSLLSQQTLDLTPVRPNEHFYATVLNNLKPPAAHLKSGVIVLKHFEPPADKIKQLVYAFLGNNRSEINLLVPESSEKSRLETVVKMVPKFPVDIDKIIADSVIIQRLAYLLLQFRDDKALKDMFFTYTVSFVQFVKGDAYFYRRDYTPYTYSKFKSSCYGYIAETIKFAEIRLADGFTYRMEKLL